MTIRIIRHRLIAISALLGVLGAGALATEAQSERPAVGDAVEVMLTTGRMLQGVVEKADADGLTLQLAGGGELRLPSAMITSIKSLGSIPSPTPTATRAPVTPRPTPRPTSTLPPLPPDAAKLPEAKSLMALRTAYRNGVKQIRYKGQVLQLMPDGLYYANLDAFDAEMFERHRHLVASAPIYAPTSTETPVTANWAELREAREKEVPVVVLRGALAFLMPDGAYYWCQEDYLAALLRDRLGIVNEKRKRYEQEIIEEAEKDQRAPNLRELLTPSGSTRAVSPHAATEPVSATGPRGMSISPDAPG